MAPSSPIPGRELEQFVTIVRRLRRECPWDRKQTHRSLRAGLLEETYEVIDAITRNKPQELREELGDVLLHVILHATIAEQAGAFTLRDVVDGASDKLIRRHPHVFGEGTSRTADEVKQQWETIKLSEGRKSLLEGIPRSLPALARAQRTQGRAASVGFDWKRRKEVWKKVLEEAREFNETLGKSNARHREEEYGDLLFALVNLARFVRIDAEHALAKATDKFTSRFQEIERRLLTQGKDVRSTSFEELDALWDAIKRSRKRTPSRKTKIERNSKHRRTS